MATNYVTLVNQGNSVTVGPPPVTGTLFERRGSEWLVLAEKIGLVASPRVDNAIVIADLASTAMSYSLGLQDAVTAADVISGIGFGREVFAADAITVSDVAGSNPSVRLSDAVAVTDSAAAEIDTGWEDSTKSITYDGSNDYVMGSALAFDPTQEYSVSLWFRVPVAFGSTTDQYTLWRSGDASSCRSEIRIARTSGVLGVRITFFEGSGTGGSGEVFTSFSFFTPAYSSLQYTNPQLGEWNHLAVTSTSTSSAAGVVKLYFNGQEVKSMTGKQYTGTSDQSAPSIGSPGSSSSYRFKGNIDQVATYQRVLNASDVATLCGPDNYQRKPQTPYLSSGNPIHLWAMGEYVTGSTMPDQIGSVDMTLYNSPTVSTNVAPAPYANRWSTKFDGTDDYLQSGDEHLPVDLTGANSFSVWVKRTLPIEYGFETVWALDSVTPLRNPSYYRFRLLVYRTSYNRDAYRINASDGYGSTTLDRTCYTDANENHLWHHLVFTSSATSSASGTGKIYLDGVHQSGLDFTVPALNASADTDRFIVGARNFSSSLKLSFLGGNIDELACWNRVLSQAEVTALYNSPGIPTDPMNTTGVTADCVALYRMGDRWNRGTVPDQIGSVDLTMSSSPVPEQIVPYNYYSMDHDGTDDGWTSIGTSTPTIDAFKNAFSVSYWINTTLQGGNRMHLWLSPPYDASASPYYARMRLQVRHQGSDGKLMARVGVAAVTTTSTTTNTSWSSSAEDLFGKWVHVAVTVGAGTSSDVKIYIDGALDVTGTSPGSAWATSEDIEVTLMGSPDSASTFSSFKNGYLDEVSLYDSELSAADVTKLYETKGMASPTNLGLTPKLYYRMGDLTDTDGLSGVVVDRMGTGMDLDSLGAPAKSTDTPT